jgi:ribosomal-protein-alanine N-acetyltransferase
MPEHHIARIRRFNMEDISQVLEIEQQAFPKTAYSRDTLSHYARNLSDTFLVIEANQDIVGYIIFDRNGHIHSTAVKAAHRRKGFGRMLFMHAQQCAGQRLWLEVRSKNTVAIEFYKAMGMNATGSIPHYYGSDDALIMVLKEQ